MSKARFPVLAQWHIPSEQKCTAQPVELWNSLPSLPPEKEPRLVRISWALILLIFPSCEQMVRVGFSLCIHVLVKAIIKKDFEDFCSVQRAVIQHTLKSETASPEFSQ